MNIFEQLINYAQQHESTIKFVLTKPSTEVTNDIDEDIKKINELGGTKKVTRIVIEDDKFIYLQSEDNGDKVIYVLADGYTYKKSLIEGLSVYCKANGLLYSKI